MDAVTASADDMAIESARPGSPARSGSIVPFIGAVAGLVIALVPVLVDRFIAGLERDGSGYGSLLLYGLVVGPILGALFADDVRADQFRIGLVIRMALLAVLLGDLVFVVAAAAEATSSDGVIVGAVLIFVLGLVVVGPFMALVTAACAAVWQVLMMVAMRFVRTGP